MGDSGPKRRTRIHSADMDASATIVPAGTSKPSPSGDQSSSKGSTQPAATPVSNSIIKTTAKSTASSSINLGSSTSISATSSSTTSINTIPFGAVPSKAVPSGMATSYSASSSTRSAVAITGTVQSSPERIVDAAHHQSPIKTQRASADNNGSFIPHTSQATQTHQPSSLSSSPSGRSTQVNGTKTQTGQEDFQVRFCKRK